MLYHYTTILIIFSLNIALKKCKLVAYLSSLSCDQFFLEFSFISIIVSGSSKGKQKSSEFVTKEKTHHPIWLLQFNQQCTSSIAVIPKKLSLCPPIDDIYYFLLFFGQSDHPQSSECAEMRKKSPISTTKKILGENVPLNQNLSFWNNSDPEVII